MAKDKKIAKGKDITEKEAGEDYTDIDINNLPTDVTEPDVTDKSRPAKPIPDIKISRFIKGKVKNKKKGSPIDNFGDKREIWEPGMERKPNSGRGKGTLNKSTVIKLATRQILEDYGAGEITFAMLTSAIYETIITNGLNSKSQDIRLKVALELFPYVKPAQQLLEDALGKDVDGNVVDPNAAQAGNTTGVLGKGFIIYKPTVLSGPPPTQKELDNVQQAAFEDITDDINNQNKPV